MKLNDFLTESNLDGYYLSQKAAELWAKDNPGKQKKDFFRAGVDVQDKYTEKAGGKKEKYLGKGASQWRTESLEALARHVKEGVPLPDSLFRYQSEAYFDTFKTAKKLREAGSLPELDWESEEMLGTDIGESVELKGVGRVWLDVPYLEEADADDGMIGEPDQYYDEEERKEAYNDLQTALDGVRNDWEKQSVIDGICPECSGTSYMDGDYDNDEDSCYGWGNYGCDGGEMENASWVEIIKFDQQNVDRQKAKDNYPGDEEVIDQIANMVKNMDDPRDAVFQLQADYPHMGKAQRASLVAQGMKKAGLTTENTKDPESKGDCEYCLGSGMITGGKTCPRCDGDGEEPGFGGTKAYESNDDSGEAMVAKMLAKALGDENRWTDMSASELYAELESENSYMADMIKYLAKMLYDIKLQERAYKDVGVADVVKDRRGKEFKFDKGSKQFKSIDGEVAGVNTKLGKDLLRLRRNAMKRTSPSYPKNKMMASVGMDEAEYQGKDVELNKPKRGGSKKYYVYVKNPKTGNVKKISFGDPGLKTKSGNKSRAKSFAARHNCEKKNDKMKAGYWACRLPRYGLVKGGKWW